MEKKTKSETTPANKINDSSLKEIASMLESAKIIDLKKINTRGEFESNLKQEIKSSLNDKYKDLEERFSEVRKTGLDMGVMNFRLMALPLKIRVFLSTYEKKDIENVLKRIKDIETELVVAESKKPKED